VPIVSFLAAVLLPAIAAPDSARTFDVTPIADGVYAVVLREELGMAPDSNGVFETFRVRLAGDAPLEKFFFKSYFAEPAVARAHALARGGG
jgi:hypothetical protein